MPFPKGETYYCPSNTASGASGGDGPNSRQGPLPCVGLAGSRSGLSSFLYKRDLWAYEEEEENSISLVGLISLMAFSIVLSRKVDCVCHSAQLI